MHNWQHTGYQKQQFDVSPGRSNNGQCETRHLGLCPMGCGKNEDPFHYIYCRSDVMSTQQDSAFTILIKGLEKLKTAPSLNPFPTGYI
jgi:hypothetical protein